MIVTAELCNGSLAQTAPKKPSSFLCLPGLSGLVVYVLPWELSGIFSIPQSFQNTLESPTALFVSWLSSDEEREIAK